MPTLAQACRDLDVSWHTLKEWMRKLDIKATDHPYDDRVLMITEEDVDRIRQARSQMPTKPVAPPVAPRVPTPTMPLPPALLRPSAPPRPYSMRHEPEGGAHFKTNADAARWLTLHADISDSTPKGWDGWRTVELTKEAVLRLALGNEDLTNWRVTWRLHPCADAHCVCQRLLPGGHPAED